MSTDLLEDLGADGPASPPRSNGELVFAEPWESRAFGMMLALHEDGLFTIADFQRELITSVAEWEALGEPNENYRYYECWLRALERVVATETPVQVADIDHLAREYLVRPAGHDHGHDHDHDHHHH